MDHKLVLEKLNSAAVYTLLNTIIYFKFIIRVGRTEDRVLHYGYKNSELLC